MKHRRHRSRPDKKQLGGSSAYELSSLCADTRRNIVAVARRQMRGAVSVSSDGVLGGTSSNNMNCNKADGGLSTA